MIESNISGPASTWVQMRIGFGVPAGGDVGVPQPRTGFANER